jgi:hypothetical protein
MFVLHPLPRNDEIPVEQMKNGVNVRMAILSQLIGLFHSLSCSVSNTIIICHSF